MNISQIIQSSVQGIPLGQVFSYQDLPGFYSSSSAVIKAVGRLVADKKLERLSKGKFYVPKKGVFGVRKPSDRKVSTSYGQSFQR